MSERYKLRLSKQDQRLYDIWNRQYPVSEWERWRNQRIACVQGNANDSSAQSICSAVTVRCPIQQKRTDGQG